MSACRGVAVQEHAWSRRRCHRARSIPYTVKTTFTPIKISQLHSCGTVPGRSPANTTHCSSVVSMLGQRRRRWTNIETTLDHYDPASRCLDGSLFNYRKISDRATDGPVFMAVWYNQCCHAMVGSSNC